MGFAPSMIAFAPALALAAGLNNVASHLFGEKRRFRLTLRCSRCGESLGLLQSSGVLAYLWHGGRCTHCGARRRLRFALLELLTGALVVGCFLRFGFTAHAFLGAAFVAVLVVLAAIDFEHRIIPNVIVVPAGVAFLLANSVIDPDRAFEWIVAAVAGSLALLAVALVYRGSIGLGDVKLAFLLGAVLGGPVLLAYLVGFVAAGFTALFVIMRRGFAARKETIPLGPFLAAGAVVALLLVT